MNLFIPESRIFESRPQGCSRKGSQVHLKPDMNIGPKCSRLFFFPEIAAEAAASVMRLKCFHVQLPPSLPLSLSLVIRNLSMQHALAAVALA